jgi:hypothetical protein
MDDPMDIFREYPKDEIGPHCPENSIPADKGEVEVQQSTQKAQQLLSKRFAKLRHKALYLDMEEEDVSSSFKIAQSTFISSMFKFCHERKIQAPFESTGSTGAAEDVFDGCPEVKDLYRKIMIETHPDKTQGLDPTELKKRLTLYHEANEGKVEGDFRKILKVAFELDLSPEELTSSYLDRIEEEINKTEESINKTKSHIMWNWYYASPEEQISIFEQLTQRCPPRQE